MKPIITYDEFAKMDMRIGKIINVEEKEGSEKLLRLTVDFGDEGQRNILSGIKQSHTADDLVGKKFLFIINLQPRRMMGEDSEGMILMAEGEKPIALIPAEEVSEGSIIT
jgi:methionyl-tRNA synthetase